MAAPDLSKIKAGPCKITLDGTDVGHTEGGTDFNFEPQMRERVVDKYGTTVVDLVHTGDKCEVVVRMKEWVKENVEMLYPVGTDGTTAGGDTYIGIGKVPGTNYSDYAMEMILHPLAMADADYSYDVKLWKVVPKSNFQIKYVTESDYIFEATFFALPDESKTSGMMLGYIGAPER